MAPKKKVRGENGAKVTDSGEDGEMEIKNEHGDVGADGAAPASSQLTQQSLGVGGPEAPRMELAGMEVVEYSPGKTLEGLAVGTLVRCDVDAKYLTLDAEGLKQRRIWGSDPYTDNSDLVAVAMHASVYVPSADPPKFSTLVLVVRVVKHQGTYHPSAKNGLKTRCLTGPEHEGNAIHVEGSALCKTPEDKAKLTHVLLRPIRQERFSIKAHNALTDVRVVFSLSNEPAFKYSLSVVADRAPDAKSWTSVRFKTHALYLETAAAQRLELSLEEEEAEKVTFRLASVPAPRTTDKRAMLDKGVPLPREACRVLQEALDWGEVLWGVSSLRVREETYKLVCCFWLPTTAAAAPST